MEGRCESDFTRDEVYPATFGDEEKCRLKLYDDEIATNFWTQNKLEHDNNKRCKSLLHALLILDLFLIPQLRLSATHCRNIEQQDEADGYNKSMISKCKFLSCRFAKKKTKANNTAAASNS